MLSALGEMGRATEALRRYERFAKLLATELDVPPDRGTVGVIEGLRERIAQSGTGLSEAETEARHPMVTVEPSYPLDTASPLVGRNDELRAVLHAIAVPASQGHGEKGPGMGPRLIMVIGEAGIGKTRLLAEIAAQIRRQGALPLAGACYEQEGMLPYGPIHDALLDYGRMQPARTLQQQFDGLLAELALIVPDLRVHALLLIEEKYDVPRGRVRRSDVGPKDLAAAT